MNNFRFEDGCHDSTGWYCDVTKMFRGNSGADAQRKAADWVAELEEKDERVTELERENAVAEALLENAVHVDEWIDIVEECSKERDKLAEAHRRIDATVEKAKWFADKDPDGLEYGAVSWCMNFILKILTGDEDGKDGE